MKLVRHTLFNLIGLGAPLLLALVSIPVLVGALGPAKFGVLTLIWAVTSYLGLFDLGLGRALTQQLAVALARGDRAESGALSATALLLLSGLGMVAGLLLALLAPAGLDLIAGLDDRAATLKAFYLMALALPAVIVTAGLRGMLEANHQFGALNAIRLPLGLWTFAGPWLAVALAGPDLVAIGAALLAGRWLALLAHGFCVWRGLPMLRGHLRWQGRWLRPLCTTGGWLTVSNVVSPMMGYLDRFVLAALVSATAVAYYATPLELVTKLSVLPAALTAVLLPALAAALAAPPAADAPRVWPLCEQSLRWLMLGIGATAVPLALFAEPALRWWIGAEFAQHGASLLRIFCIGIAVNCLAHVPLTLLHSAGAMRVTALIHCLELPLFLLLLWGLTRSFGTTGAASAWLLRMSADTALLFAAGAARFTGMQAALLTPRLLAGAAALALGFAALLLESAAARGAALFPMIVLLGWSVVPARTLTMASR